MPPDHAALAEVRDLEERAWNAWPALQTLVAGGWLLRFADGYTRRANSVNAWQPSLNMETVLAHAAPLYAARGLPLVVRLSPLAGDDADAVLAARGFLAAGETLVMTAPLEAAAADAGLRIAARPAEDWLAGFAAANDVAADRRAIHDRMLGHIPPPAAFATLAGSDGVPLAFGLAAVERGMAGLFDIVTLPAARRQGAGRRLVRGLMHWASRQGATAAYLQVAADNMPAIALYRHLGFAERYRYHYRIAPGDDAGPDAKLVEQKRT